MEDERGKSVKEKTTRRGEEKDGEGNIKSQTCYLDKKGKERWKREEEDKNKTYCVEKRKKQRREEKREERVGGEEMYRGEDSREQRSVGKRRVYKVRANN